MYNPGDLTFIKTKCIHCGWFGSVRFVQSCAHCHQDAFNKCDNEHCYCQKKETKKQNTE